MNSRIKHSLCDLNRSLDSRPRIQPERIHKFPRSNWQARSEIVTNLAINNSFHLRFGVRVLWNRRQIFPPLANATLTKSLRIHSFS